MDDYVTPQKHHSDASSLTPDTTQRTIKESIFLTPSASNICILCHEDITIKFPSDKDGSAKRRLWDNNFEKTSICKELEEYLEIEISRSRDFQSICRNCCKKVRSALKVQQKNMDDILTGRELSSSQFLRSRSYSTTSRDAISYEPPSKKKLSYQKSTKEKVIKVEITTDDSKITHIIPNQYESIVKSLLTNNFSSIYKALQQIDENSFSNSTVDFVTKIVNREVKSICSTATDTNFVLKDTSTIEQSTYNKQFKELEEKAPCLLQLISTACIRPDIDSRNVKKTSGSLHPSITNIIGSILYCRSQRMNASAVKNSLILRRGSADKSCFQRFHKLHVSVEHTSVLKKQTDLTKDLAAPVMELKLKLEKALENLKRKKQAALQYESSAIPVEIVESSSMQVLSVRADESFFDESGLNPNINIIESGSESNDSSMSLSTEFNSLSYLPVRKPNEAKQGIEDKEDNFSLEYEEPDFSSKYVFVGDNVDIRTKRRQYLISKGNVDRHLYNLMVVKNRVPIPKNLIGMKALQLDAKDVPMSFFIPSETDECTYISEIKILVLRDLLKYFEEVQWMKKYAVFHIPHEFTKETSSISEYFPLGIIDKNENTTEGIIDIMREQHRYVPGDGTDNPLRMLSFGDLLTVERQENAQEDLRDSLTPSGRLEGLIPVLADFHTYGNFLEVIWHLLYTPASANDIGTLFQARNFLNTRGVPTSPMENVNGSEDLLWKYSDALLIAAFKQLILDHKLNLDEPADKTLGQEKVDNILTLLVSNFITPSEDSAIEKTLNCPFCNKTYKKTNTLRDHIKTVHKGGKVKSSNDSVLNYSVNALALCYLARNFHDARRHGDGERVARLYKYLMMYFKLDGRHKYAYHSLLFLSQISFLLPKALAFELKWNRFVNTKGKIDSNVEIDRHIEHENKYIKADLKQYQGKLTDQSIARSSKSYGKMNDLMDVVDSELDLKAPSGKHTFIDATEDVKTLGEQYWQAKIFENQPGRYHWRFPATPKCFLSRLDLALTRKWILKKVGEIKRKNIYSLDDIAVNI